MSTALLVSLVVVESIALAALAWFRGVRAPRPLGDPKPTAMEPEGGLLADYRGMLREVLTRVGVEGEGIAYLGARLSEHEEITNLFRQELTTRITDLVTANGQLRRDLDEAQQRLETQCAALDRLSAESRHDYLTQLPNRRAFSERLVELFGRQARYGENFVMVIFDVDHFKRFNDEHGHAAGDIVLMTIATVIADRCRSTDFVARIGGEEFAILLSRTTLRQAQKCVDGYRQAIETASYQAGGRALRVTASFGAAELLPGETCQDLQHRADQALYAAKDSGRNCARFHDGQYATELLDEPLEAALV